MARRHQHRAGDWVSVARRLDELLTAQSGEDALAEALPLLVAKLAHDAAPDGPLVGPDHAVGERLGGLLARAEARWPGVTAGLAPPTAGEAALRRCAEVLDAVSLAGDHAGLDAIFEGLVATSAKGRKGQFFTPRHVVAELAAMVAPRAGERVVDPACGSGGFLHHALARAPGAAVFGADVDPRAVRVARVLLAAAGGTPERIFRLDALRAGALEAAAPGAFDVVLTNPPFAGDVGDAYPGGPFPGRRAERDVLFLARCVDLLRPGGRFAIVLPYAVLAGSRQAFARRWLVERAQVVAVLALGRNTFQPHTGQKAAVVVGRKRAAPGARPEEPVLLFVSDRDGKDPRGRLVRDRAGAVDHDLGEATAPVRAALEAPWGS